MKILRMTEHGKVRFIHFLDSLKTDQPQEFPQDLLAPSDFASAIGGDAAWLDALNLDERLEAAKGLDDIVGRLDLVSAERDWGFWTWCSAYLFDRLCKKKANKYMPGELPIWIAEPHNWQRYYRHYLASIWQVYAAHREKERELVVLMTGPINTPGELWAQIAANQTLVTNKAMLDAVYHLFWDEENGRRKRGAGGEAPRRLTRVLRQFEKTYDFFAMTGEQIVQMMPGEFDRFKEPISDPPRNRRWWFPGNRRR